MLLLVQHRRRQHLLAEIVQRNRWLLHVIHQRTVLAGAYDPIGAARLLHPLRNDFVDVGLAVGDIDDLRPGRARRSSSHARIESSQRKLSFSSIGVAARSARLWPEAACLSSSRAQGIACTVPSGVPSGVKACISGARTRRTACRRRVGRLLGPAARAESGRSRSCPAPTGRPVGPRSACACDRYAAGGRSSKPTFSLSKKR